MKEKLLAFLKKNRTLIIIIVLLMIILGLVVDRQSLKFSLINHQAIPDIEIGNTLMYFSSDNSFKGEAKGFVAFDNAKDQPKGLRQYYIIKPTNQKDENSNQIFSVEDIMVMDNLPPHSLGSDALVEKNDSDNLITLEDKYGNRFFINKDSKEISMKDATGDSTKLITSESSFRDFMRNFLRK